MEKEEKIFDFIKKSEGLTITEIVELSRFSRSTVRTILAKLEGASKVKIKNIGMAKVYSINK